MNDEEPTLLECPASNCKDGMVTEDHGWSGTVYRVTTRRCIVCDGSGCVTPLKFAEYKGPRKV